MRLDSKPTVYDGHEFRSRLEAKWAVFFNEVGVTWKYESQWFVTEFGNYLPDFFIPICRECDEHNGKSGYWVEIKPFEPSRTEIGKMQGAVRGSGHNGFIVYGAPGQHSVMKFVLDRRNWKVRRYERDVDALDSGLSELLTICCRGHGGIYSYQYAIRAAKTFRF